jgi:hypothetical protein
MTGQAATVIPWPAIAALALVAKGQVRDATFAAAAATDEASLSRNDWRTIWALEADALSAYWAGDTERALASAGEMVRRSQHAHAFLARPASVQLAGALHLSGEHDGALAELAPLDGEQTRRLLDLNAGHGWDLLVRTRLELGELDSAEATAVRAAARADAAGLPCRLASARCAETAVALARGESPKAVGMAREARAVADAAGNPLLSARARALCGLALAAERRRDDALAELGEAEQSLAEAGSSPARCATSARGCGV